MCLPSPSPSDLVLLSSRVQSKDSSEGAEGGTKSYSPLFCITFRIDRYQKSIQIFKYKSNKGQAEYHYSYMSPPGATHIAVKGLRRDLTRRVKRWSPRSRSTARIATSAVMSDSEHLMRVRGRGGILGEWGYALRSSDSCRSETDVKPPAQAVAGIRILLW